MATSRGAPKYTDYQEDVCADISAVAEAMCCQPILFVGSGLSKRYFSAPSWDELLGHLASICPLIDKDYAYYKQALPSAPAIGEEFAKLFHQWAWSSGKSEFPKEMFSPEVPAQAYLKFKVAQYLDGLTPSSASALRKGAHSKEIESLQAIQPHAIVTTNYDRLLELLYPDFQSIIGQQILHGSALTIGELFKIHGCTSDLDSIVVTQSDYDVFTKKKKYLSAKLLTFFSEHPLFFIGYSASDSNIRAILSDIDEALPMAGGLIPNVFIMEWKDAIAADAYPARERLIAIEESRSVRIRSIECNQFGWVFDAIAEHHSLPGVNPKVLRAILARSFELVRHDIPRKTVEADFKMLEHAIESPESFAKLFGITTITDPSAMSANYPYTLTDVANKLSKNKGWNFAQQLLQKVKAEKGVNLKASDNKYHCTIKSGEKSLVHKYSDAVLPLLRAVRDGQPYTV